MEGDTWLITDDIALADILAARAFFCLNKDKYYFYAIIRTIIPAILGVKFNNTSYHQNSMYFKIQDTG